QVLARSLRPMERALFANPETPDLQLGIPGFRSADLHDTRRLADLTRAFADFRQEADSALFARYRAHREGSVPLRGPEESALLLETGAQVSRFLGRLFGVERDLEGLREAAGREAPLFRVKRDFVQRRVFRKGPKDRPRASDFSALDAEVRPLLAAAARRDPRASFARDDAELLVAIVIETLLEAESAQPGSPQLLAWHDLCGALHRGLADAGLPGAKYAGEDVGLARKLLDLFDRWLYALSLQEERPDWVFLRLPRPLDFQQLVPLRRPRADRPEILAGHEEHQRRRDGFRLTDPRMSAREVRSEIDYCIYCHEREKDSCAKGFAEKDSPRYRKNPLRFERQHPRPYSGVNVLVVGMGPAGYTLAHHLLNEGFGVVGIDGLKIEPIAEHLIAGPIERIDDAFGAALDERVTSGFGG